MSEFTVAICTYCRLELLRQTLESLSACAQPGMRWDVLVVDNAGDARVRALAESFRDRLPINYIVEPTTGTSHARNRALRECEQAGVPIVLFTDDDVTFDAQWLVKMAGAIWEHPECDFWGGRIEPVWPQEVHRPAWFDDRACPMLGDTIVQYHPGDQPRPWNPQDDAPFFTANLALRVAKAATVGSFDTSVGHRGGARMGMEDSLMVKALAGVGGAGWYAADAVVYHPVQAERLTRPYMRRFAWRQGWLSVHLVRQGHGGRVPRWVYRLAVEQTLGGAGRWLRGAAKRDPGLAFTGQFTAIYNVSRFYHALFGSATPT